MATSPQLMEAFKNFSKNRNNPNAPTLLEEGVNMATQPPAMPQAPDVSPQAQNVPSMVNPGGFRMRLDGATNDPFLNSRTFAAEQGLQIPSPNSQREQELLQRQTLPQFSELEAEANQRLANMPAVDFGGTGRQDGTQAYPFSAPQQAGPQSYSPFGGISAAGSFDAEGARQKREATMEQFLKPAAAYSEMSSGKFPAAPTTQGSPTPSQPAQTPSATTQEPPASPQTPVATTTQPSYDPNRQFAFQGGYTNPLAAGIEMAGGSRQVAEGLQGMTAPQQPQTPQQGLTSPGGMPLSEFLAGGTDPSKGITRAGLQTDPQGRMITPGADRSAYEQKAAEREARIGQPSEFFAAQTSGNVPSDVRQIQMKDPRQRSDKENKRLSQFASSTLGKQLESQGVDLMTGKLAEPQGLTFDQKLAQDKFNFDVGKFNYEQAKESLTEQEAAQRSEDAAKYAARDMLRQHKNVMDKAQRAGKNIGFTTTGATGALLGIIPGTKAYDQKSTVETLQADAAFETLRKMREASKTGGALGQVSERELALLEAAVGNLKTGQSSDQFRDNLNEYINMRNDSMLNVYDAFANDYGTEAANEAFMVESRQDLMREGSAQRGGSSATPKVEYKNYEAELIVGE